jgi:MFS family permease
VSVTAVWHITVDSSRGLTDALAFDAVLLNLLYAYPAFQQQFGTESKGSYQIPAMWQTMMSDFSQIGYIIGVIISGWVCDKLGYRKTIIYALVFSIGCIFITVFANSLGMILAGEILCGVGWGCEFWLRVGCDWADSSLQFLRPSASPTRPTWHLCRSVRYSLLG